MSSDPTPAHQSLERTIDYVEIPTLDIAATKTFFTGLFGWRIEDYGPEYAAFDDGRMAGGFYLADKVASLAAGSALIIFYQRDLAACETKVRSLGGQITRETFSFPGGRRFHFTAPGGSEFAVWTELNAP